ncbi:MAG: transglycosylase SLT domain-containing protein [Deltaproteobacteria bacterium]|nr:transglycosylase SLT domain-containing protein [Deltaproteobacteria bacterium]
MDRSLFLKSVIIAISIFLTAQAAYGEEFPKVTSKKWTSKYDVYFRKYTKRYFGPGFDWKWFKAQAIAESNLNNRAQSWVRAKGIMQILPRTFSEIKKKNPSFIDINEPRWNIAAGIYYDRQLYKKWKAPRPFNDRMAFTFGSYNAGFRTILKAQEECKTTGLNENLWTNIREVAPKVRKWRHKETIGYVERIHSMMY